MKYKGYTITITKDKRLYLLRAIKPGEKWGHEWIGGNKRKIISQAKKYIRLENEVQKQNVP